MSVLPGYHERGTLPRVVTPWVTTFTQSIDPAALPADPEAAKHEYNLKAGAIKPRPLGAVRTALIMFH